MYLCLDKLNKMAQRENKVIYLLLKEDGSHHFYGCLASLYDQYNAKQLGISYGSLRNYGLSEEKPYENARCLIVKGTIIPKPNSRTMPNNEKDENNI